MAFEETREQQQMYNYFRSCIYIFLIIEIVMNLPITADNRVTQFILDLLARFKVFNSVSGCKVAELICICVVCIGTKAKKALKFNVKTMVIYPVLAGLTLVGMCFIFHGMNIGMSWFGFPADLPVLRRSILLQGQTRKPNYQYPYRMLMLTELPTSQKSLFCSLCSYV